MNKLNRGQVKCKRMMVFSCRVRHPIERDQANRERSRESAQTHHHSFWMFSFCLRPLSSTPCSLLALSFTRASVPRVAPQGYERIVVMKS